MKNFLLLMNKYHTCCISFILSLFFLSSFSYSADGYIYSGVALSSTDGYLIDLSQTASISKVPTVATDGTYFYKVGPTFKIPKSTANSTGVTKIGDVKCDGGAISITVPNGKSGGYKAYHRVFTYIPMMPYLINGRRTYQLSYNTFITMTVAYDSELAWRQENAPTCNSPTTSNKAMRLFYYHLPIEIDVYIKKKNIDGITVIPSMDFAGYVRAFSNLGNDSATISRLPSFLPITSTTAPMRLKGGTIISPAECRTDVGGSLIINHGVLNAEKYESRVVRPINFSCDHSIPTPVEFELFYTKDNDPQQRLPLKVAGTSRTIYSKIQMIDAESGNKGQRFISRVGQYKQIQIESILKGENASGGNYSGTAVLIASYP